ncbi:MAG: phosphate acyltransferase PlsX [Pseudomonadota bacterium]
MSKPITISVDAMGGDHAPDAVLDGAAIALKRRPESSFLFFGDTEIVAPALESRPTLKSKSQLIHTDVVVQMDDKPSQALRHGRWKSSMWRAIQAVRDGEADVCISAGNTGALMAMSKFCLKTMPGIERPAIAAIWPTLRGESIVLDVGATIGADARQLVDFAVMGEAMARALFEIPHPSVGLLNIGVEEIKGLEEVREAGQILREIDLPLRYHGFVEGDDLGKGTVDVVVTEGFAGNIALKTAEGTARQLAEYLRSAMSRTIFDKIGYLFAKGAFATLRQKMDPRKVNGGVFLGLNGIVIKSHGSTDGEGFASAIELGAAMARNHLLTKITEDINAYIDALEHDDATLKKVARG